MKKRSPKWKRRHKKATQSASKLTPRSYEDRQAWIKKRDKK